MKTLDADRQKLLERKFGRLLSWEPPPIQRTVGPFDLTPFREFDGKRRELIHRCERRLEQFTDAQIEILQQPTTTEHAELHRTWKAFVDVDIDRLKDNSPPWYAAGLGHPDYAANFDHWSKASYYSIPEIVSLSVGVEPGYFDGRTIEKLLNEKAESLKPVLRFFMARFDLIKREFDPQQHGWRVNPKEFLTWAERFEVEVPEEFLDRLRRLHRVVPGENTASSKKQDKREIDKIAQLFTAMVIDIYGYRPGASRSNATSDVQKLAASLGLEISDDTIRKYLRIGGEFIPEDWAP